MIRHRKPPSPSWRAFFDNHFKSLVSIDFFTVPTVRFRILFVFLVLSHDRRRIVHFNVTEHPSAAWTGRQLGQPLQDWQRRHRQGHPRRRWRHDHRRDQRPAEAPAFTEARGDPGRRRPIAQVASHPPWETCACSE